MAEINPNFVGINIDEGEPNYNLDNELLKQRIVEVINSCPERGIEREFRIISAQLGVSLNTIYMTVSLFNLLQINEA